MDKLPVIEILRTAFKSPFSDFNGFTRALLLPSLLLVLVTFFWTRFVGEIIGSVWLVFFAAFLIFMFFALTCHRYILSTSSRVRWLNYEEWKLILRFSLLFLLLYFITEFVLLNIFTIFIANVFSTKVLESNFQDIQDLVYLIGIYFFGRWSMVLPATAIGEKATLKWSWNLTKNNGLNLFFILGIFPLALNKIVSLAWRIDASVVEQVLLSLVWVYFIAVGIFALSLSYINLVQGQKKKGSP